MTKLLDVLKATILQALCANRFSVSSTASAEMGNFALEELIGAVKERRIAGGGNVLSGVEGADASAIVLDINEVSVSAHQTVRQCPSLGAVAASRDCRRTPRLVLSTRRYQRRTRQTCR